MHLIILFGVIAKLAFASGHCDVGALNFSSFDITKFSGIWFWQYHNWNEFDKALVCPAIAFSDTTSRSSRVTTYAYDTGNGRRVSFSGTVVNLDKVGYISYDEHSIFSGRFNVLASDPDRYSVVQLCSEELDVSFLYVATRRECPDEETQKAVERVLNRYKLSTKHLVKWCNVC